MTETNNQSARGLDGRGQAEPPELSVGNCSRSSLGRLSRIEGRSSRIEKVKPQNVIPHQTWMIKVP